MIKMLRGRQSYSTAFSWVFGLVSMFGLGIMYIVFNQVFMGHLVPTIKNMINSSMPIAIDIATQNTINSNIDKYMTFFHLIPFIIFFIIIIYMFLAAIRKERESEMY